MSEEPLRTTDMVDITDCFEAVNVFRVWRNLLFAAVLICVILLQGTFWVVDVGWVKVPEAVTAAAGSEEGQAAVAGTERPGSSEPSAAVPVAQIQDRLSGITFGYVIRWVQVANGMLLLSALLYWLTQLFTLLISIVGRLGGMNHICRAFFFSLVALVLVIPWQYVGPSMLLGATFSAQDLAHGFATRASSVSGRTAYYLRFSAYPLAVLAILILAHLRSVRWAKAILRRLEII